MRTRKSSCEVLDRMQAAFADSRDDLPQGYLMNRRAFVSMVAAGAPCTLVQDAAAEPVAPKARNIVLVQGLFADGSSWSEVIAKDSVLKGIDI
jgi:hypothetical protein